MLFNYIYFVYILVKNTREISQNKSNIKWYLVVLLVLTHTNTHGQIKQDLNEHMKIIPMET